MKKIGSPSLGLWEVQNPCEHTQTHDISGKRYPTWPCFVVKNTPFFWSTTPHYVVFTKFLGVFLTTKHGHVGYRFPLISWVWVSSRGFWTSQRPREGDPIFFKKPYFFNFTETCFGIPWCCRILVYMSLVPTNSFFIKLLLSDCE